jgi:hypothetical protein
MRQAGRPPFKGDPGKLAIRLAFLFGLNIVLLNTIFEPMSEPLTSETVEIYPRLDYRMRTGSGQRQDGLDFLLDFRVKITGFCDSIDDDRDVAFEPHLGDLRATLVRISRAGEEGFSLFDIFDQTQELSDLGAHLFTADFSGLSKPVREAFPYAEDHLDVLLVSELTLHPAARGQRAAISALHRFITDWEGNCSFVAIEAQPMQFLDGFDGWDGWQDSASSGFAEDREQATAKLENHIRGLGFRTVETVPFLLYCPAMRQAPLEELALEDTIVLTKEAVDSFP